MLYSSKMQQMSAFKQLYRFIAKLNGRYGREFTEDDFDQYAAAWTETGQRSSGAGSTSSTYRELFRCESLQSKALKGLD